MLFFDGMLDYVLVYVLVWDGGFLFFGIQYQNFDFKYLCQMVYYLSCYFVGMIVVNLNKKFFYFIQFGGWVI